MVTRLALSDLPRISMVETPRWGVWQGRLLCLVNVLRSGPTGAVQIGRNLEKALFSLAPHRVGAHRHAPMMLRPVERWGPESGVMGIRKGKTGECVWTDLRSVPTDMGVPVTGLYAA